MAHVPSGDSQTSALPHEHSYGSVAIYRKEGTDLVLFVKSLTHWGFSKGHPEGSETPHEAARRELREETGITDIRYVDGAEFSEQYIFIRDGMPTLKKNTFFLGFVSTDTVCPQQGEIEECRFVTFDEAVKLATYPELIAILEKARAALISIPE